MIDKIKLIASYYGKEPQLRMLAEECSELAKEALKAIRSKGDNREALIEEMADVEIMLAQIKYLGKIEQSDIDEVKAYKLDRQLERIQKEENHV